MHKCLSQASSPHARIVFSVFIGYRNDLRGASLLPQEFLVLLLQATCYMQQGKFDEAESLLQEALTKVGGGTSTKMPTTFSRRWQTRPHPHHSSSMDR